MALQIQYPFTILGKEGGTAREDTSTVITMVLSVLVFSYIRASRRFSHDCIRNTFVLSIIFSLITFSSYNPSTVLIPISSSSILSCRHQLIHRTNSPNPAQTTSVSRPIRDVKPTFIHNTNTQQTLLVLCHKENIYPSLLPCVYWVIQCC